MTLSTSLVSSSINLKHIVCGTLCWSVDQPLIVPTALRKKKCGKYVKSCWLNHVLIDPKMIGNSLFWPESRMKI